MLCRVLKHLFAILLLFCSQNATKLAPLLFLLPLHHCLIQLSGQVLLPTMLLKSLASKTMDYGTLSNFWHSLFKFLYNILSSFGHFLAWSEVGVYMFMMLMIFFGFNWSWFYSYLLVSTRNVFHQHKYQDSRIVEEHRFWGILSSIYGLFFATSFLLQTHNQSACFSNQKWWSYFHWLCALLHFRSCFLAGHIHRRHIGLRLSPVVFSS